MFFSDPVLAELGFKALLDRQGDSLFSSSGVLSVLVLIPSASPALCAVSLVPCWSWWFVQNQEAAKTRSVSNLLLKLQPWCGACTAKGNLILQAACQAGKSDSVNSRNKFTFWGGYWAGREALEPRASLETWGSLASLHMLLWHIKECFALSPVASHGLSHPQGKLEAEEDAWHCFGFLYGVTLFYIKFVSLGEALMLQVTVM